MSGGIYLCDVRVHHNYSENIDRNGWNFEMGNGGKVDIERSCQLN